MSSAIRLHLLLTVLCCGATIAVIFFNCCSLCFLFSYCGASTITKICLYNFDPRKPHFYRGTHYFLICIKTIDNVYSLEPPSTHNLYFEQKYENISFIFTWKFSVFMGWNFLYIIKACFCNVAVIFFNGCQLCLLCSSCLHWCTVWCCIWG